MDIHRSGISDIFISPNLIQKLLSGKHMIGRGRKEVQKLQLLGRHFHRFSHIKDRIIGLIDHKIRVFHAFYIRLCRRSHHRLVTPEDCLYPSYQFLGIKGLFHIVVCTKLKTQHLVKDLSLGREHDNRYRRLGTDLPAYLISVNSRQHQIQKDQIRPKGIRQHQCCFSIRCDHGVKALLCQI